MLNTPKIPEVSEEEIELLDHTESLQLQEIVDPDLNTTPIIIPTITPTITIPTEKNSYDKSVPSPLKNSNSSSDKSILVREETTNNDHTVHTIRRVRRVRKTTHSGKN